MAWYKLYKNGVKRAQFTVEIEGPEGVKGVKWELGLACFFSCVNEILVTEIWPLRLTKMSKMCYFYNLTQS